MEFKATHEFAIKADKEDVLAPFRERFHIPKHEGKPAIYFCGNSLGLQPKNVERVVLEELESWKTLGVEGHFKSQRPWMKYHSLLNGPTARIVGAKPEEVVIMNNLSVNLHLLMVSFYRPSKTRHKILMEPNAFPSDQYAIASQAKFHGFDPEESVIELVPREGEQTLRTEDICDRIKELGSSLALVFLGGVNYYTGQSFDMESITKAAHEVGAVAGFDLAHAAGNIALSLHDWEVDFAAWCTYKYLNSGPGSVSGVFVHEKHGKNSELPRFAGWWGHNEERRFLMEKEFQPMQGAEGWQLSNPSILTMAAHFASLQVFEEAGFQNLVKKGRKLASYLKFLIDNFNQLGHPIHIEVITPRDELDSGCQVSLVISSGGKQFFQRLSDRGIVADWREPDVIRVAPVPLYNQFTEVFRFFEALKDVTMELA